MAKRTNVIYQGVTVALPKGVRSLTADMKATIDAEYSDRRWSAAQGKKCRGVFFNRDTFVLRCNKNRGKKESHWSPKRQAYTMAGGKVIKAGGMSTSAKSRFKRQKARGELCLRKGLFTSKGCRRSKK